MKPENIKIENIYINGDFSRVEIYFQLPIACGIYMSNIISLSIFIDGLEIDPSNMLFRKGDLEIPYNHLSLLKYEYIDPKETISIFIKNPRALSQGNHKIEIQTTYLEYSKSCDNNYRQINKYQPFLCEVTNRFQ